MSGALLYCWAERDPTEHVDLAATMPAKLEQLKARLRELRKTLFNPDRCAPFTPETGCARAERPREVAMVRRTKRCRTPRTRCPARAG